MANEADNPSQKKHRTPALWMIIFIYFCFAVYGVMRLSEAVTLSFSDQSFMFTSFFFSIVFWILPLLFVLLGFAAVGLFWIREWARILSVVLAWAIIILRIVLWIDLMMREFVSLPLADVFAEALILTVVSAFFMFVYYYFNIPKIKKIFVRREKKEKLQDAILRNNRKGFALWGPLLALLIIFMLFLLYFKKPGSCPFSAGKATLTEYGINTSSPVAIKESIEDEVQEIESQRLKEIEMLELEQQLK